MKTVLSIAGFDPSSGAGITADLMAFAAHGLFGVSCITALTVQSTVGVRAVHPVGTDLVRETLECLREDLPPVGIKIGMLGTSDNVRAVTEYVGCLRETVQNSGPITVLDPVMTSSSGAELLDGPGIAAMELLLADVDWITPNTAELERLSGCKVEGPATVVSACKELQSRVAAKGKGRVLGILATGGHLDTPSDFLLTPSGKELWISGDWVHTPSTHGTGCALSSAYLSCLVLGYSPADAARRAKGYVTGALMHSARLGSGNGPMNHLWPLLKGTDLA